MTVPSCPTVTRISTRTSPEPFLPGSKFQLLSICDLTASSSLAVSGGPDCDGDEGADEGVCACGCGGAFSFEAVCWLVRFFSSELKSEDCWVGCAGVFFASFGLGFTWSGL